MANFVSQVQELYVAYFGRPADPDGLKFWADHLENKVVTYDEIAASFAQTAEYKTTYFDTDHSVLVQEIYDNLFGRGAEPTGLEFWVKALDSGAMTVDNMVTKVAKGAQGEDQFAFNAKLGVAIAFTNRIDTPQEKIAYSGDAALMIAINYLAGVKNLITGDLARDPGAIDLAIARMSGTPAAMDDIELVGVAEPGGVFV